MRQYFFAALLAVVSGLPSVSLAAQDHSMFSRMPGYKLNGDPKVVDFGRYGGSIPFQCKPDVKCSERDPGFDNEGHLVAEGKVTAINYSKDKNSAGTLAVFHNYENAVKELGGRRLTQQSGHEGVHVFYVDKQPRKAWVVLENYYDSNYKLTIIEAKPMQQVITAGKLGDALEKQGYATLYVNFDNNSAAIKADSQSAVNEIVALLKNSAQLKISIEGHTDNVGSAASNKTLSQARAKSVMQAVVAGGIDAKRLQAKGFGSEVPVADNRTEEGRAKNRRVELVRLK